MKEKWYIIKKGIPYCLALLLSAFAFPLQAQIEQEDSVRIINREPADSSTIQQAELQHDTVWIVKHDTIWAPLTDEDMPQYQNKYDHRIRRYRNRWEALIPVYSKIQFAGNIGLISVGPGWDYGRHNQWETDMLFGILPKYESRKAKLTFTLKQNYIPWDLRIKESPFSINPLTCGMYVNTVFGDDFWVNEPDRYPKGYYGFSSKIRFHVFLGQRVTFNIDQKHRFMAKQISLFYEISTCDLYVISAFTNKYLKPKDYLSLSFGIKMQLI